MTEKKTKKKRELVKADPTTTTPNDNGSTYDPERVPVHKRRADGQAVKSNGKPYTPGVGNPKHANVPEEDRCSARRARDGKPCQKLKIKGADVCGTHGGRAPQVRRNAMARIMNNAQKLVDGMVSMALDEDQPAPVRIAASRDLLDRGGVRVPDKVDVSHDVKPYESLAARITRVPSERVRDEYDERAADLDDDRY